MIPRLLWLSSAAPKDHRVAWDQYWARIKTTGAAGDVLWDSGDDHEMLGYLDGLKQRLDPGLPVVDVGCGNGSFTRWLGQHFPEAIGVDVSAHAVARAHSEPGGPANVSYMVRDMTAPGAGAGLVGVSGANVFIRGVLHILDAGEQAALAENLRLIVGTRGTVFLAETDFRGNAVEYVAHLGATLRSIPAPLEGAIRGLPMPGHFGAAERSRAFPPGQWELIEDGPTTIEAVPMKHPLRAELIPGYFAVLRTRR